ncbi:hypothetical protein BYT27DRAFT_7099707, partial [Phlegmacium glaucopus]
MVAWTAQLCILLLCVSECISEKQVANNFLYEVINPIIRMSWIQKHWEREFVDNAETKIKKLMIEYCMRAAVPEEQPLPNPKPGGLDTNVPAYMSLAEKYGLIDDDMDIGNSRENKKTVEQEYQAYITASLSQKTMDIVKFWEKEHLNFTEGWLLSEKELVEDDPDEDLLRKLLNDDYQDAMD